MPATSVVIAYFSPETVLPVTSLLATVLGVVMMFGRTIARLVVRRIPPSLLRGKRGKAMKGPHFQRGGRIEKRARGKRG
jgi:hypothetical protein